MAGQQKASSAAAAASKQASAAMHQRLTEMERRNRELDQIFAQLEDTQTRAVHAEEDASSARIALAERERKLSESEVSLQTISLLASSSS